MANNNPFGWTTLEQAKKLVEIGVDPITADMMYVRKVTPFGCSNYTVECTSYKYANLVPDDEIESNPCWSLGALENMLPTDISTGDEPQNKYELRYRKHKITENHCVYQLAYGNDKGSSMEWHDMINTAERDTMIEAVCDMLFWLLANNHIKNNNNGK